MYFLFGAEQILENIVVLAKPYADARADLTRVSGLKDAYQTFLVRQQPEVPVTGLAKAELVTDGPEVEALSRRLAPTDERATQALPRVSADLYRHSLELLRGALDELRLRERPLAELFDLVINKLFTATSPRLPGSGTLILGIGTMYVNPEEAWTVEDVAECLVHEFTHCALWLDEFRHGHHPSRAALLRPEHQIPTAILGERRPFDVVFHSTVVAAEVLALRAAVLSERQTERGIHGPSALMAEQAAETAARMLMHSQLSEVAAPRCVALIEAAQQALKRLHPVVANEPTLRRQGAVHAKAAP